MKIRTRLLLFLLPTLVASTTIICALFAVKWYGEIVEGFRMRLKSAVLTTAATHPSDEQLLALRDQLHISNIYPISLDSIPSAHKFWKGKDVHITPIYTSEEGEKLMTGYAPIYDQNGHVLGFMAADLNVNLIDKKFQESLFLIILCAGLTIIVMVATLFFLANKISRPVQKLNNSALAIAAGQYGESVQIKGPKEIAELANTLNTMSECLHENINRLKENSLLRERMYGEYECAMLLQHMMLQKNIDDCTSDAVAVKSITFFSENPRGLLLDFPKHDHFQIHLAEAPEEGFEGMYQLLTHYKLSKNDLPHTTLTLKDSLLHIKGPHTPLFYSLAQNAFLEPTDDTLPVESGDYLFLFNQGLLRLLQGHKQLTALLSKVLTVFASDGLETLSAMLHKELSYTIKRKPLEEDIHLLCFQVLIP
jgi:HAMP domain-containing protein